MVHQGLQMDQKESCGWVVRLPAVRLEMPQSLVSNLLLTQNAQPFQIATVTVAGYVQQVGLLSVNLFSKL